MHPSMPARLRPGDSVAFVAPGSTFSREKFELGEKFVKSLGLVPVYSRHLFSRDFIFAGTVEDRVSSLRTMLNRDDIKAIWYVRGGSGSYAVAQAMAKDPAPKIPKIMIGLSDVTALHLLMIQKWKWQVIHGPLLDRIGTENASKRERKAITDTLFEPHFRLKINSGLKAMGVSRVALGSLTGGNLTLVASSLGSQWEIDTRNKILFLEEVGERAYRLERMLTQLESAGKFKNIRGLVLGDFTDCKEIDNKELWKTVLKRHFQNAPFPVLSGVHSGHGALRLPLPLGAEVCIRTRGTPSLEVLEDLTLG